MLKKVILSLLGISIGVFALVDASIPYIFSPNTPARSAEVNANFDSLKVAQNRVIDSLDAKFVRYSDLDSADTNFNKIFIDTVITEICSVTSRIGSPVVIADSLGISGNSTVDGNATISGNATITGTVGVTGVLTGTDIIADSVYSRAFSGDKIDIDTVVSLGLVSVKGTIDSVVSENNISTNSTSTTASIDTIINDKITSSIGVIENITSTISNFDTSNYANNKVFSKSDSLLYSIKGTTDYLLSAWKSVGGRTLYLNNSGNTSPYVSTTLAHILLTESTSLLDASNGTATRVMHNIYYASDNKYKRRVSGAGAIYQMVGGVHSWVTTDDSATPETEVTRTTRMLLNPTGELQLNVTAETISATTDASKIFAKDIVAGKTAMHILDEGDASAKPICANGFFIGTWTGMTTTVTDTIWYQLNGKIVTLRIPEKTGTSNTNTFTITGVSSHLRPSSNAGWGFNVVTDEVRGVTLAYTYITSSGVITFAIGSSSSEAIWYPSDIITDAGFWNSGTKGTKNFNITYYLK